MSRRSASSNRWYLDVKIIYLSGGTHVSIDSFGAKGHLEVGGNKYEIFRLDAVPGLERLRFSLKVLAENVLRAEDGANISADHARALAQWEPHGDPWTESRFTPARMLMQAFT